MTRKRSSPMGLEIYLPVLLAFIMLPLLVQAAPLQDYTEIQQYTEGCYYNYNHYNEGDRIMTNEPCLNCTCHNKMLMCYLRVCPFTKPIGHDCIVEKREDQCCPIITCPEVPVDVAHVSPVQGTDLSIPEKFGCSIDGKFYLEGAQVPSNPNKPCELCYCIKNRTSCLMQECTLHIDGCTPIYNKGSCCPVRYNCDHENDVLELEDHSTTTEAATTTTTKRPTTGFLLTSTMTPSVSTDCVHNGDLYADGARITGETACENCYCMRGDIICAVQECQMPMLNSNGKSCHALPPAEGECCPSNYMCEDDTATTQIIGLDEETKFTTAATVKDLHSGIPEEDLQLQAHIDDEETATKTPSTEVATEDGMATKVDITTKPAERPIFTAEEQDKKEETELETVTEADEKTETTSLYSSDDKAHDSEELVTKSFTNADELFESTTKLYEDAQYESKVETTEEAVTKTPASKEEEQKHTDVEGAVTNISIAADELSETSTDSTTDKEFATETSTKGKPDTVEDYTKIPAVDIADTQQATEVTSTDDILSASDDEIKPTTDDEVVAMVTIAGEEKEKHKPDEYITEADVKSEHEPDESTTKSSDESLTETPFSIKEEHKQDKSDEEKHKPDGYITEAGVKLEHESDESTTKSSDEFLTETSIAIKEEQNKSDESSTVVHLDIEHTTETVEKQVKESATQTEETSTQTEESATKLPLTVGQEQYELSTDAPITISEEQTTEIFDETVDKLSTKTPSTEYDIATEDTDSTTYAPSKISLKDEFSSTEEPLEEDKPKKVEKDKHELVTKLPPTIEEREPSKQKIHEGSNDNAANMEEGEIATRFSVSDNNEQLSFTAAPEGEEESNTGQTPTRDFTEISTASTEDNIKDTTDRYEEASGDRKQVSGEQQIDTTTSDYNVYEKHTPISISEHKPIYTDELGSGDYSTEVSREETSEYSSVDLTTEGVTSVSPSQEQIRDYVTSEPVQLTKEKPIEQESFGSGESAESEEDDKLVVLTTSKPIISEATTSADKKSEGDADHLDITTIKTFISADEVKETVTKIPSEEELSISTETSSKDTTEVETSSEDKIDITTMASITDKNLSNKKQDPIDEHTEKLFEETPSIATSVGVFEELEISSEKDKLEPENGEELIDDVTTQKSTDDDIRQTTSVPRFDIITENDEDKHKLEHESGEELIDDVITQKSIDDAVRQTTSAPRFDIITEKDEDRNKLEHENGEELTDDVTTQKSTDDDIRQTTSAPRFDIITEKDEDQNKLEPENGEELIDDVTTQKSTDDDIRQTTSAPRFDIITEKDEDKHKLEHESGEELIDDVTTQKSIDDDIRQTTSAPRFDIITEKDEDQNKLEHDSGEELTDDVTTQKSIDDAIRQTTSAPRFDIITEKDEDQNKLEHESGEELTDDVTTQKSIDLSAIRQTTSAPGFGITMEKEEDQHKTMPETSEHKANKTTGIVDDTSVLMTIEPTAQDDVRTEPEFKKEQKIESGTIKEPSTDFKVDLKDEFKITTIKPVVEKMPDMELPSVIPGEGDCLVGQKTYENNTIVPTSDECEIECNCVSSIVTCVRVKCDVPENIEKCTLDESSSYKCCPTYICGIDSMPSKSQESAEPFEEDGYKESHHTTISSPHKVPTEFKIEEIGTVKSETTTFKPVLISDVIMPGVSIPEIEMPSASTEEPMSHVKDEDEFDQETTKYPIEAVADDKETIFETEVSKTPTVIQSISPIEQEQPEIAPSKAPAEIVEMEFAPDLSADKQKPELEMAMEGSTTIRHGLIESATDSTLHISSETDKNKVTPTMPLLDEYQTTHPFETDEAKINETELETQTSVPITLTEEKTSTFDISEEPEVHTTVPSIFSTEEFKEIETQTSIPSSSFEKDENISESTATPSKYNEGESLQDPETATAHPITINEGHIPTEIVSPAVKKQEETFEKIKTTTSSPAKDIDFSTVYTEYEQKEQTTEDYSENSSDFTTDTVPSEEHISKTDEETSHTTGFPSIQVSTTQSPPIKIKDHSTSSESMDHTISYSMEELESNSATSDILLTEKSEEDISTTTLPSIFLDDKQDHSIPAGKEESKKTIQSTEKDTPATTDDKQPETQQPFSPTTEQTVEEDKEKDTPTSTTEESPAHTTTFVIKDDEIATEKSIDFDTKIDTSSSFPSINADVSSHNIVNEMSTTVTLPAKKTDEQYEEVHTLSPVDEFIFTERTQSEEIDFTSSPVEKITEPSIKQVKEELESSVAHTDAPSFEEDESVTKPFSATDKNISENDIEHSTTELFSSGESTSKIDIDKPASSIKESTKIIPQSTQTQVKQPSLDLSEEASGESVESEEEISTEPVTIQYITEHVNGAASSTVQPISASQDNGEEDDNKEMETGTDNLHVPTVEQDGDMMITTEHAKIPDKSEPVEVSTDELSENISVPISISENEAVTKSPITSEEEDFIPKTTKSSLSDKEPEDVSAKQPIEHDIMLSVTNVPLLEQESEDSTTSSVIKGTMFDGDFKHLTTQQPKISEEITGEQKTTEKVFSSDQTEFKDIEFVTKATAHIEDMEDFTTRQPESEEDINIVTRLSTTDSTAPATEDSSTDGDINIKVPDEENVEKITARLPTQTDEISDVTGSPLKDTEDTTTQQVEKEITEEKIETISDEQPEEDDVSSVKQTTTSIDEVGDAATKPTKDAEQSIDVTKISQSLEEFETTTTQLPTTNIQEESQNVNKMDEEIAQVPTMSVHDDNETTTFKLPELVDRFNELPARNTESEEESNKEVSEMSVDAETSTDNLHEITEQSSELPEFEEGKTTEDSKSAEVSTDKFSEQVTELAIQEMKSDEKIQEVVTESSVDTHTSTEKLLEIAEHFTELPTKGADSEEESLVKDTELPMEVHISSDDISETITHSATKDVESEEIESTQSPMDFEVSINKLLGHDLEMTIKETESKEDEFSNQPTELPVDVRTSTDKSHEHVTESLMKDINSDEESRKETTQLPEVSTDNISETVTDLPLKNIESEEESHKQTTEHVMVPKIPAHKMPDVSHKEEESDEQVTEIAVDEHVTTDKIFEHITELPTKDNNESEKQKTHEQTTKLSLTTELPEHITDLPTKDIESEEQVSSVLTEKIPILEDHVTELPKMDTELEKEIHKEATESPVVSNDVPNLEQTLDKSTESDSKDKDFAEGDSTEDISSVKLQPTTTAHPLFSHHTTLSSVTIDSRIDDNSSHTPTSVKDEEAFTTPTTTTVSTTTPEPITTSAPHYQPPPPIYGQHPQYGPTQYEDEYTDEDEGEIFGPGTCRYGGKLYVSAQQIPRDDPCDFCFCFRSDIICLQQSCPPPITGCHEEPISGFCCPRYECPVSMATVLNITTSTTTTSTTLPPHFLHHSYGNNVQRNGCLINGRSYRVGEKIESTSGPCINCTCGGDGKMKCDPQACVPEPTMQQVMAVVAAGRKR